jgi:hypothetical protein
MPIWLCQDINSVFPFSFIPQKTVLGLLCISSSDYGAGFTCEQLYDGITAPDLLLGYGWYSALGDGNNSFVQINFPSLTTVGRVTVYHGCWAKEQFASFTIEFSDGSVQGVSTRFVN